MITIHAADTAPILSRRLLACSAIGLAMACGAAAHAQSQPRSDAPVQLPPVSVEGKAPTELPLSDGYKPEAVQSKKITTPLLDTPKTIQVVPQQVIQDQGARDYTDVLRNVPGISLQGGEGGGGNTETLRLRGFSVNESTTVDGRRDRLSMPVRDTYNIEQVEVLKGSSASYAGRSATSGAINIVTKEAGLDPFIAGSASLGTANETPLKRLTADANQTFSTIGLDNMALRLNVMKEEAGVPGRDEIENERWGLAASLAAGIGTDTRAVLNLSRTNFDNMSDYGLPSTRGAVQVPIDRDNYYGLKFFNTQQIHSDSISLRLEHDFNDWLTLRNQTAFTSNGVFTIVSPPRAPNFAANTVTANATGNERNDMGIVNQTDATVKFETFGMEHTLVGGMEIGHELYENTTFTRTGGNIVQNLLFPDSGAAPPAGTSIVPNVETQVNATTTAFYAFDTLKINEQFELSGGLRWDQLAADQFTKSTSTLLSRTDTVTSWSVGGVYKPVPTGSIYVNYSTAFNPAAESLALSGAATNAANIAADPEKTVSYEIGTKWDLMDQRLSVSTALFRTLKTNARTQDPNDPLDIIVTQGEQEVYGIEFGVSGAITDRWNVYAGYAVLDGEITSSKDAREVGHALSRTPEHSASFWTTYELPWNFQVGAGAQYVGRVYINTTTEAQLPSYWLFDAMLAYHLTENIDVRLNGYNLTDEYYIAKAHGGGAHLIPGPSRSAVLSTSFKF